MLKLISLITLITLLVSCSEDAGEPTGRKVIKAPTNPEPQAGYFPIESGNDWKVAIDQYRSTLMSFTPGEYYQSIHKGLIVGQAEEGEISCDTQISQANFILGSDKDYVLIAKLMQEEVLDSETDEECKGLQFKDAKSVELIEKHSAYVDCIQSSIDAFGSVLGTQNDEGIFILNFKSEGQKIEQHFNFNYPYLFFSTLFKADGVTLSQKRFEGTVSIESVFEYFKDVYITTVKTEISEECMVSNTSTLTDVKLSQISTQNLSLILE